MTRARPSPAGCHQEIDSRLGRRKDLTPTTPPKTCRTGQILGKGDPVAGKSYKAKRQCTFAFQDSPIYGSESRAAFKVGSLGSYSNRLQRPCVVGLQKWE